MEPIEQPDSLTDLDQLTAHIDPSNPGLTKLAELTARLKPFGKLMEVDKKLQLLANEVVGTCLLWGIYTDEDVGIIKSFMSKDTLFPAHQHPQTEWIFIMKGTVVSNCGGELTTLNQYEYQMTPPNTPHELTAKTDAWVLAITMPSSSEYPCEKS